MLIVDSYVSDFVWRNYQSYLPRENRLTDETLPNEYFIPINGMRIHVDHYRVKDPRAKIVLFHGIGGNGRLLSFIALPLARAGIEVICPDLPLYGYTDCRETVTYNMWLSCGSGLVKYFQEQEPLPTFLFGLSAGGMLAYQIASACEDIKGLIVTCILDQRERIVRTYTARNPIMGMAAKPALKVLSLFLGNVKIPMRWIGNMKAISNNRELVAILVKDTRSSGAKVSLAFLDSLLSPVIEVEPEEFQKCPFLLVHPENDNWTDIKLSRIFYDRLACEKRMELLEGAGHFPIEDTGLKRLEAACLEFVEQCLSA